MSNSDKDIQHIFQDKLGELESHVPDHLWSEIAKQLPAASGTSIGAASKPLVTSFVKWAIGIAAALSAVVGAVMYTPDAQEVHPTSPATTADESQSVPTNTDTLSSANAEQNNISIHPSRADHAMIEGSENSSSIENHSPENDEKWIETSTSGTTSSHQTNTIPSASQPISTPTPSKAPEFQSRAPQREVTAAFTFQRLGDSGLSFFFIPKDEPTCTFHWDFGDGKTSGALSPNHLFELEGQYTVTLTVTASDGYQKETSQTLCAYRPGKIKAPNAFSPGNDNTNEYFDLRSWSSNIAEYKEFNILDSNGKIVFTSTSEPVWNGLDMAGNLCLAGDYSFTVICFDECQNRIVKAGPVRLFRP